ncbi:MAG: DUF2950 domain-containing protein [Planctomycetota bacterium]|jgi:hypothetical protein
MRVNSFVLRSIAVAACALGAAGCATKSPAYTDQQTFDSPTSAVDALAAAARGNDVAGLEAIFGSEADELLSSGDPVMDRHGREVFAVAIDSRWSLDEMDDGSRELVVGHEQWPFPIPLVKDRRGWWFDTAAGAEEILARRIGRNELAVIGILRTCVRAQREYAGEGRDGKPAGIYARQFRSDPGIHNGLYWESASPADRSPLSALAADAAAEGYSTASGDGPIPFHGYYFRILTRQGEHAPRGARDYVVDGEMTGGFAAIAFPAEYESSGIMTFIVGQNGLVFEADLGEDTPAIARAIEAFDPDDRWQLAD